eukprot:TRINITY_DN2814_c0_g1_i8.p1 TRINITY_DN2814_c0_g1~~TRINITY_DN2814_c0_g1_i8.p1  ORF type:complete len:1545 (+),score=258.96 TRINITY_DN2814_c0_g1_i8:58-4692(+)
MSEGTHTVEKQQKDALPSDMKEEKSDVSTILMFLHRTLKELQRNTGPRKNASVYHQAQEALTVLESKYKNPHSARLEKGAVTLFDPDIEVLIAPLQSACESKLPKLVQLSLDCFQKLIGFGCLRSCLSDSKKPGGSLMTRVINTICSCYDSIDEGVQIQLIKALLSLITSHHTDIHDTNLLNVLRACIYIYTNSKTVLIEKTVKTTITQILHTVFARFEQSADSQGRGSRSIQKNTSDLDPIGSSTASDKSESELKYTPRPVQQSVEDEVRDILDEILEKVQDDIPTENGDKSDAGCLKDQSPSPAEESHLGADAVEQNDTLKGRSYTIPDIDGDVDGHFSDTHLKDSFMVFRYLCKQSVKKIPEWSLADSVEVRRKVLALEMIQIVLINSGPFFRVHEVFISSIKQYLCMSLLKNGVSSLPSVFGLSLSIFLTLIANFKDHLKNEIGVFFTHVFLSILESHHSNVAQKLMIVSGLFEIAKDPQTVVEIFLNYDCDENETDIFGRMVNDMAKIARGGSGTGISTPIQEKEIRNKALRCLVSIVQSMLDWCKDFDQQILQQPQDTPKSNHDLNMENEAHEDDGANEEPTATTIEKKIQAKRILEKAVKTFESKPEKAIRMLTDTKILGDLPEDIANFLHTTDGLSKVKIGEYLGEPDQFNVSVMHAYIDQVNFSGITFDEGIRTLLKGFRLPGEAQKIDRIMEKFAEKYCRDNSSAFKYADTAYVLAYSIIMLNTDAHNPMVKTKMTKAEFVKNSTRLHEDEVLEQQFLEEIYDRIVGNEIRMNDDSSKGSFHQGMGSQSEFYHAESVSMITKTQKLFKQNMVNKTKFYSATQQSYIRLMFEVAWCPTLSVFSTTLEEVEDQESIELCLSGFTNSIKISSLFLMETERNAFVTGLSKFTSLISIGEVKYKNVEAIRTLVSIAFTCGNRLQTSWEDVLRCISELERLRILGSGVNPEKIISGDYAKPLSSRAHSLTVDQAMHLHRRASISVPSMSIEEFNSIHITEQYGDIEADMDKIFHGSINLSDDAIIHFVKKLCEVSLQDIESPSPRIFCLQKIVEIASLNMSRIRYVWSNIWSVMAHHFCQVSCRQNFRVSMYAIDSLRQLAMKFLEKDELVNYHFQKEFLKPFEHIMSQNRSLEVRELIIRCLQQMIEARAKNIKSGWKSIFIVFSQASTDGDESINSMTFQVMEMIVQNKFGFISESLDSFVDCMNCLVSFGCNPLYPITSTKAVELIRSSARVYMQAAILRNQQTTDPSAFLFTDAEHHLQSWFPILTGLSRIMNLQEDSIKKQALTTLVDLLVSYGSLFSPKLWELIFRGVLYPMFDDIRHETKREEIQSAESICIEILSGLTDLFSVQFPNIKFMLKDVLGLYQTCIKQVMSEKITRASITCLHKLVVHTVQHYDEIAWSVVTAAIESLVAFSTPSELMTFQHDEEEKANRGVSNNPSNTRRTSISRSSNASGASPHDSHAGGPNHSNRINFHAVRSKCVTQLLLIQMISDLAMQTFNEIDIHHLSKLSTSLLSSYEFASTFNKNTALRVSLWKAS